MKRLAFCLPFFCLAILGAPRAAAEGDPVKQVYEFMNALKDVWDWGQWVDEAGLALDAQKPLPTPPGGMKGREAILARLAKQLDDVDAIPIPAAATPVPQLGAIPSSGFDAIRAALRPAAMALTTAAGELEEMEMLRQAWTDAIAQIKAEFRVLAQVRDVFLDVGKTVPIEEIQKQFVFAVVDIEFEFTPALTKVENAAIAKEKASRLAVVNRAKALTAAATDLRNALLVEELALTAEAQRLAQNAEKLQKRLDDLEARQRAVDFEEQAIQSLSDQIKAQEQQIVTLDRSISNYESNINFSVKARTDYIEAQRVNYRACPQGQSYLNCTHEDLKAQFDARSAQSDYVIQRNREIDFYNKEISNARQRQSDLRQSNVQKRNEVNSRTNALVPQKTKLQNDRRTWNADARADLEDRWRSRANLHWQANQTDLAEVNAALTRLTALGGQP